MFTFIVKANANVKSLSLFGCLPWTVDGVSTVLFVDGGVDAIDFGGGSQVRRCLFAFEVFDGIKGKASMLCVGTCFSEPDDGIDGELVDDAHDLVALCAICVAVEPCEFFHLAICDVLSL